MRHPQSWLLVLLTRPNLCLIAGAFLFAHPGTATPLSARVKSERLLKAIIAQTPAPQLVAEGQQLKTAERAAARISGAVAYWGIGASMEPLYATNTAIIVVPIEYAAIKKGMTVVYLKSNGGRVAHTIVGETRGGYLVQGINNDEPDAGVVNEENLIGVIVSAYSTADSAFRIELTQRLAARGRSPRSTAG